LAEDRIRQVIRELKAGALVALDEAAKAFTGEASVNAAKDLATRLRRGYREVVDLSAEAVARYGPAAVDLRFLQTAPEVAYDLYRVSRYSYDIVRLYAGMPCRTDPGPSLGLVKRMVEEAVEGYLAGSADVYRDIEQLDDRIDDEYLAVVREVLRRPDTCGVVRLLAFKFLERASDHATYIAEKAYYVATGTYPEQ